ncbi:poly [ADP-ribose] polymerase tankyrase-2 isoform X2 [Triticum aestivum]|uniref:poly [ADP-ribose] polymerase tankyrase-2 isoform X2 n=1 Tax=Triticum aestivum TaxID=4565 RepID=UPI001D024BAF|nr:poly [ADP-ribose] polymerase tankyrase-2-like isoform X2 [Triticum aestivum]
MAAPPQPPRFPSAAGVARAISSMQDTLLDAAFKGDLPLLKRVVWVLDNGKGRPREAVEAARADGGMSALLIAAANEQLEVCSYLAGVLRVDVDAADDKGRTPLFYAVMSEKIAVVKCLLDHGADPDKADEAGLTPLHAAAGIGNCEMIKLLLAKGAYVDPIAEEIGTPLHLATKEQQVGAMKTLLEHNADCNKTYMSYGLYPMTPLFQAVNVSSLQCVKLLVEAGAVINPDCIETVSFDSATGNDGSTECLNFLLKAGAKRNASNDAAVRASARGRVAGTAQRSGRGRGRDQGPRQQQEQHVAHGEEVEDEHAIKREIAKLKSSAIKAIESKDYFSATMWYTKAIEHDPNDATLFSNRSLCLLRMGDGQRALLDALDCRGMRPDWPKAYYRQGAALMSLKDYINACVALLDGFKLDPENAEMESALREAMEYLKISKGGTKGNMT